MTSSGDQRGKGGEKRKHQFFCEQLRSRGEQGEPPPKTAAQSAAVLGFGQELYGADLNLSQPTLVCSVSRVLRLWWALRE